MGMEMDLHLAAFLWGIVSAVSLPLGAFIAFSFKISKKWNCALLAFGAGALLFALTNEIYGEALCGYDEEIPGSDISMILLGVGSLAGSFIFSMSNYFIENKGGFLRKFALRYTFLTKEQKKRESQRVSVRGSARLSRRSVGYGARSSIRPATPPKQRTIADLSASIESDAPIKSSPLLGNHRPLNIESSSSSSSSSDSEEEAHGVSIQSPTTATAPPVHHHQLGPSLGLLQGHGHHAHVHIADDNDEFLSSKEEKALIEQEFLESAKDAQIGVAIWMGILIDAFPESLVIGLLARSGISFTFIVGVFLSNLPEALSSTVIMQRAGFSKFKILMMWLSITIITGLGAILGVVLFEGPHTEAKEMAEKFVEGVAAGAMLVMVAETALPEAFHHAGKLVGFSTLFGFLSAYYIKLLEKLL